MHALRAPKPRTTRLIAGFAAAALGAGCVVGLAAPTQAATVAGPANLSATPNPWSTGAVDVSWEQGKYYWELEQAGEDLVEYEYEVREAGSGDLVEGDQTLSQTVQVDGLEPGTAYTVEVASVVDGDASDWATAEVTTYDRYVGAPSDITIQGSLTVGSTLSVVESGGAWENGADVTYEWFGTLPDAQSSGPVIATGKTLPLTAAHLDMAIYVTATGTKQGVATVSLASAPNLTTRVTNPAPPVTTPTTPTTPAAPKALTAATPKISGKAKVGRTLTANPGHWTDGAKLSYQWKANGKPIKHATKRKLALTKALRGSRITVTVTGSLAGYETTSKASAKTPKVTAAGKAGSKSGKGKGGKGHH